MDNEHIEQVVLASAFKNLTQYYAAVQRTNKKTGEVQIWASAIMVKFYRESWSLCAATVYKEMDESMGPNINECPEKILNLLSPTTSEYAIAWRKECRERIAKRKKLNKMLVHGNLIKFKNPIKFTNGYTCSEVYVWKKKGVMRFSACPLSNNELYRPNLIITRKNLLSCVEGI
jgi:hypothetical protein